MADFTEREIKELDIDWYCLVQGIPTHIASMGGMIPKAFRDRKDLRYSQDMVAGMEPVMDVNLNVDNIRSQTEEGYSYLEDEMIRETIERVNINNPGFVYLRDYELPVRLFAATFVEKARRGFRSYARIDGLEEDEYILIASPLNPVGVDMEHLHLRELECVLNDEGNRLRIIIQ